MSVIAIIHHDENIKKIVPPSKPEHIHTAAVYSSKGAKIKRTPIKTVGIRQNATMGIPQEHLKDPCDFLKKKTGRPSYSEEDQIKATVDKHRCRRKPKLFATKEEVTEYNTRKKEAEENRQNFVIKNIKTAIKMKPKEPVARVVLEPHGDSKRLIDGLEPIYINSDKFGKTPLYLQNLIKKNEKLHQMQKDVTGVEKPKCRYIRRDEREQLLEGLKHNWEELQQQYQGLPILTDTIPKINRKSKLESELKQLEKDIVLVERHPYIYVYDENVTFS